MPAFVGVYWLGDAGVGRLKGISRIVLSLQLPFAIWPLIRSTRDRSLMGAFASGPLQRLWAWAIYGVVSTANLALLLSLGARH